MKNKKFEQHLSYKVEKPQFDKRGVHKRSKRDQWKTTRVSRFRHPHVASSVLVYPRGRSFADGGQWLYGKRA